MPKVSQKTIDEVERALGQYRDEVRYSGLSQYTRDAYVRYARFFVQWLQDEFIPKKGGG